MAYSLFAPCKGHGLVPAEIISADSMQVYRGMDIGTAKPGPAERARIPHHLIDILDPREQFTAGDFARRAEAAILDIQARGRLPVLVGGTVFYLKTLIFGPPPAPPSDPEIRAEVRRDLERLGAPALMEELAAADPVSAARIHLNDAYRLTRALEVWRLCGRPLSSFEAPASPREDFDFLLIALELPRGELYRRIDERTKTMMEAGLAREVEGLMRAGHQAGEPGMRALGYKEFFEAAPDAPLDLIAAEIAKNTRQYAKRQLTFLRSIRLFECFGARDKEAVKERLEAWLIRG
jgi:tRNA dimethylallyltransferase